MKVELFYSPGCEKCLASRDALHEAAQRVDTELDWRELNVLDDLDYAVSLGVLTLPALAIDGELAFTSLPTTDKLETALRARQSGNR